MGKSIKLSNRIYLDEASINKNFGKLNYDNTSTSGAKWTYVSLITSGGFAVGNKISKVNNFLQVQNCSYISVSVKLSISEKSYNYKDDLEIIIVDIENNSAVYHSFENKTKTGDYNIASYIIQLDKNKKYNIGLAKYTDSESCNIVTSLIGNYLCVEILK